MERAPSPRGSADRLARALDSLDATDGLVDARLAIAASVTGDLARAEPVVAGLVVGSTALRRCSPRADLDLVVVTPESPGEDRFSTRWVDGTRVEVERLGRDDALALTAGDGWVWELRNAARLGTGVPVFDPDGFGARLAERASAMLPSAERYEATLRAVYEALIELGGRPEGDPARRLDALRGCLDNLTLLALLERPRRYQKPKWALADLLYAGEHDLLDALLAAYGIGAAAADDRTRVAEARELIDLAFGIAGAPSHDALLAMGHAPEWVEASYVSRTLDDAGDLAASGRAVEAQYTALFAARLAAGVLVGDDNAATGSGVVEVFTRHGLAEQYLALFPAPQDDGGELLPAALTAASDRRRAFAAMATTTVPA